MNPAARHDPWHNLRRFTPARIAIGRAGASLPTKELLDFQLAHALARDAVHQTFDAQQLERDLSPLNQPILHLQSAAPDRQTYLLRPDQGRRLAESAARMLASSRNSEGFDVSITLSD